MDEQVVMYFTFATLICHLIISVNLSLEDVPADGKSNQKAENPNREILKETTKPADLTELVNLKDQYHAKNTIDDFEMQWARSFKPDLSKVDKQYSPARQAVEIRRQKWRYIFDVLGDSVIIKRLESDLKKAEISCTTFVDDIAEAYFQLSYNGSVFNNEPAAGNPLLVKSVQVFINSVSDLKLNSNEPNEMVQIPKSVYLGLLCKDAQASLMKHNHADQMNRVRDECRKKVRQARLSSVYDIDSELSLEFE